jgi:sulfide:quinone oxidoreductase
LADRTTVVLGCGTAGVAAAAELRRLLPRAHRIVVIDRDVRASYPPSYPWLVVGQRKAAQISRDRARLARRGIEFVHAEVRELDLEARHVWADSREFKYDHLIVALGLERSFESAAGLGESAQTLVTLEGAERLAATLRYFAGGKVVIASAPGADVYPFAAYETSMLLEHYFMERKMRQKVDLQLYTPESRPLAFAGAEASETILGLLAHKGIELVAGEELYAVDPGSKEATFSGGASVSFDLLIALPETRVPSVLVEAGLAAADGRVAVDGATMETEVAEVYAVGDLARHDGHAGIVPFPAGEFARYQALTAAREIAFRAEGGRRPKRPEAKARFLIEIGAGAAASVIGRSGPAFEPEFRQPSIIWHWARLAMEKQWLLRTY